MDNLIIKDHDSVGFIKFGMRMEEVEQCMEIYKNKCNSMTAPLFCEYDDDDDGKVTSIHLIIDILKEHVHCTYKGIDLYIVYFQ